MIKFIPYPVITGFTTGIAVIIATSQIKDFFGLKMGADEHQVRVANHSRPAIPVVHFPGRNVLDLRLTKGDEAKRRKRVDCHAAQSRHAWRSAVEDGS